MYMSKRQEALRAVSAVSNIYSGRASINTPSAVCGGVGWQANDARVRCAGLLFKLGNNAAPT